MRARLWVIVLSLSLSPTLARSATAALVPGATAPALSVPGGPAAARLDSLRGKVVLVDFWASWCSPCRQSFPWLGELQQRLGPKGLAVVAVNLDKRPGAAASFLAKYPAGFPVVFDPAGAVAEAYGVRVLPTSVLLDRAGRVLAIHPGFDARSAGEYARTIEEACDR